MQAIILAAGMGKRLGHLTEENTKGMIDFLGKKLIERTIDILISQKIERIIIVVGYKKENIINFVQEKYMQIDITFVENPVYDKTNNIYSLYLTKEYLLSTDTILIESDLVLSESIVESLINHKSNDIVVVAKLENWMDGTVVTIDNESHVVDFIPKSKLDYNNYNDYYKTVNIYKFSKNFLVNHYFPFLEAYCKSMGYNEYYEDVLRVIAYIEKSKLNALIIPPTVKWYEIDDINDLHNAEAIFSVGSTKLKKMQSRYGGYWRFPALLDFCYLVNPYFPSKKLLSELISNFNSLISQYPSGRDINRSLAGKIFNIDPSKIIVGNGAGELINIFFSASTKKTGVVFPTFEEYPNRLRKEMITPFIPDNKNFIYSLEDLIKLSSEVDQVLLINPDNPSGQYLSKSNIIALLTHLKSENKTLILDESFLDFVDIEKDKSLLTNDLLIKFPNLIIIKSISKSFGVPGLRLGILATSDIEVMKQVESSISIWNINSFGEFFLQIYSKYSKEYFLSCNELIETRNTMFEELKKIKYLSVIPSQSNYFLCEVSSQIESTKLCEFLLENYNILIKDCKNKVGFNNQNYVRLSIRNHEENMKLINALKTQEKVLDNINI